MACKPQTTTPRNQEDSQSQTVSEVPIQKEAHNEEDVTSQPKVSKPTTMNPVVTYEIPTSVPMTKELFQSFSVHSHTATISTPITIAQCLSVSLGVSQTQTPLFTDSITTTTSTTVETPVTINASDAGQELRVSQSVIQLYPFLLSARMMPRSMTDIMTTSQDSPTVHSTFVQ
ncbi:unnamed protein product [Lactuca saligna]|uniref:Uncharacterized protein n=1 Tax=Lactuca saligna TaxID=75948 RepID=A0AA35XYI3_LACSI|nr:unnamed protein product [Lactuca saligna]